MKVKTQCMLLREVDSYVHMQAGVSVHWTGLLDWITGLDYWTELLDSNIFTNSRMQYRKWSYAVISVLIT